MMTKAEKEKFTAELEKLGAQFKVSGKSFENGPAFAQALQAVAVKEAVFLLCRILLSMQ
jgi:hypothetical protein